METKTEKKKNQKRQENSQCILGYEVGKHYAQGLISQTNGDLKRRTAASHETNVNSAVRKADRPTTTSRHSRATLCTAANTDWVLESHHRENTTAISCYSICSRVLTHFMIRTPGTLASLLSSWINTKDVHMTA